MIKGKGTDSQTEMNTVSVLIAQAPRLSGTAMRHQAPIPGRRLLNRCHDLNEEQGQNLNMSKRT